MSYELGMGVGVGVGFHRGGARAQGILDVSHNLAS
jgi:hypothetical protein